jgi:hypothetical protein
MMASKMRKIGGEFEIDPLALYGYNGKETETDLFIYSSGRSALISILEHIKKSGSPKIHVPYYICESVVKACEIAGFEVKFYELNENFLFPIDYLDSIRKNESLFSVNYFGFVDDNAVIENIKSARPDIVIISDQVQSFWTYQKTKANYSFTSLRKHFSLPDGGLVYSNDVSFRNQENLKISSFYKSKLIGSILKHLNLPDETYLSFFSEGEDEINNEQGVFKSSNLTSFLFQKINFQKAIEQRKENYKVLYNYGKQYNLDFIFPYAEDLIPMNVPIRLSNRDKIRKKLINRSIFLPVHWPLGWFNCNSIRSKLLSETEMSLVVDQRYSISDIEYEMQTLIKALKNE